MANEIYGKLNAREETEEWQGITTNTTRTFVDNLGKTIRVDAFVDTEQLESDMLELKNKVASVESTISLMDAGINQQPTGSSGYLALQLTEVNGKVTNLSGYIESGHYESAGAAEAVKTELRGGVHSDYNTLNKIKTKLDEESGTRAQTDATLTTNLANEITRATTKESNLENAIGVVSTDLAAEVQARTILTTDHGNRITILENKVGSETDAGSTTGTLYARIKQEAATRLEKDEAEALARAMADTALVERIKPFESGGGLDVAAIKYNVDSHASSISTLSTGLANEITRATTKETELSTTLNSLQSSLNTEISTRTAQCEAIARDVTALQTSVGSPLDAASSEGSLYARIKWENNDRNSKINTVKSELQAADTVLQNNISANTSLITALDGRVTTNEGDIDTLETNVSTLQDTTSTLNTKVAKSEQDIITLLNVAASLKPVATSGLYSDLTGTPTKTSNFTNDGDGTNPFLTLHQPLTAYRTAAAQDIIDASKQAVIEDLTIIRSGAQAGATALQPAALNDYSTTSEMNTAIAAYHDNSKLNTLATGAGAQGDLPYNLPYYFYTVPDASKIEVHTKTITLDNNSTQGDYSLDVTSATTTTAGLMSAADKTKLDGIVVPTKTSELVNDSGFLTEHQSLAAYRSAAEQDVIDATKANANNVYTKAEVDAAIQTAITTALTNFFSAGVKATTTLPTADKPEAEQNNLTFVVTATEPTTKYKGYAYIVTGA